MGGLSRRGPWDRQLGTTPFGIKVAAASAAVFVVVFFHEQAVDSPTHPVVFTRDLKRDHAPPAGAYYPGCDAARAAGVAPIYADEPGYREAMDGDGDGIACEPYFGR